MAKWRGSKGSVSFGGNVVGNVTQWECDIARAAIDATVMGDNAKKTGLDTPGASGSLTAFFDNGDTAQAAIMSGLISDNDAVPAAAILQVATGKSINMNIVITSARVTSQRGQYVGVAITFESDGAITLPWV